MGKKKKKKGGSAKEKEKPVPFRTALSTYYLGFAPIHG